jgi:hypothetical protein
LMRRQVRRRGCLPFSVIWMAGSANKLISAQLFS